MTPESAIDERLESAIALRESGQDLEARKLLVAVHHDRPDDAVINLQCAWIHDKLGLESEAVPFYERAISIGLERPDLANALLGLGSTYRTLGRYEEALATLTRGVSEFPECAEMQVFRAMALYNNGLAKEACETLLTVLVASTSDESILRYRRAITEYSADLDRTWE